ncbi:hypothetical protein, partial [Streptomyces roseus]|uniref:hypothetical protein n=1 Tax=Streptomyces roseus TaxID=66430 RepID=UPI003788949C
PRSGYLSAARSGENRLTALGGLGFAEPGPALRAGVLRFAPDGFGTSLRSVSNGSLREPV